MKYIYSISQISKLSLTLYTFSITSSMTGLFLTRLDWKVGVEKDNNNQIFIKDHWICNLYEVVVEEPEVDIVEKIKKARNKNKKIVRVVEEMKKAEIKIL